MKKCTVFHCFAIYYGYCFSAISIKIFVLVKVYNCLIMLQSLST